MGARLGRLGPGEESMGFRDRLRLSRRRTIVLASLVGGAPFLTYGSVELTSTPAFCRSCHEIAPAHQSWAAAEHAPKQGKKRAGCRDCHVPCWHHPLDAIGVKLRHGLKDLTGHFGVDERRRVPDFYYALKHRARRDVDDRVCLDCHADIRTAAKDVIRAADGEVRGLHRSEEARKVRCLVCHKYTGHAVNR